MVLPFSRSATRSAGTSAACAGLKGDGGGGIWFNVPCKEKSQTPSPRGPPNIEPPASTVTYCSPSCMKVEIVLFTPASVRNSHSCLPLLLSSATSLPSSRPVNNRPPAVTTVPFPPSAHWRRHTSRLVRTSSAATIPRPRVPEGTQEPL